MKRIWTVSALAVLLVFQTSAIAAPDSAASASALLPEVAEIIFYPKLLDETELKQDVYVGLLAMSAPEGADYMAIGSQIVLHNFNNLQKAIEALDDKLMLENAAYASKYYGEKPPLNFNLTVEGVEFQFPCKDLYAYECATDTLNQKIAIAEIIDNNATLISRYLRITKLPNYGVYFYGAADPLPFYQDVVQLSYLRLAQALMAFDAGNVNQGFTLLEEEMAFSKRMLAEDQTLIGQMLAIRRLYTTYHVISVAMDMSVVREHMGDKRLSSLLSPLTLTEQTGMARAFMTERNFGLYGFYTLKEKDLGVVLTSLFYDRNVTANIHYLMLEPLIERASLSLADVSKLVQQNQLTDVGPAMQAIRDEQFALSEQNGELYNSIGKALIQSGLADWSVYLNRLYDVQIYGAMVNAKLQILQADVKADDVSEFVQNGGAAMRNPYTQKPFEWSASTHTLKTPWLPGVVGEETHMAVCIGLKK